MCTIMNFLCLFVTVTKKEVDKEEGRWPWRVGRRAGSRGRAPGRGAGGEAPHKEKK